VSGKFIISSKIINTKHQMFWNKEKTNPTLGNRLCEAESRGLPTSQGDLRYRKVPDLLVAFHYITRPHFICKHEFKVEIYLEHCRSCHTFACNSTINWI